MNLVARVAWALVVVGALVLMAKGLWAIFYIEPTREALAEARSGRILILVACLLLAGAAYWIVRLGTPWPVAAATLTPAVICGGLTLVPVIIPILGAVVAYPIALAGILGGLLMRHGS